MLSFYVLCERRKYTFNFLLVTAGHELVTSWSQVGHKTKKMILSAHIANMPNSRALPPSACKGHCWSQLFTNWSQLVTSWSQTVHKLLTSLNHHILSHFLLCHARGAMGSFDFMLVTAGHELVTYWSQTGHKLAKSS